MFKIYILLFFLISTYVNAEKITKIDISGNDRISDDTVKMFADISVAEEITDNDLNLILKRLYESNFFESIEVELQQKILKINVKEFPIVQDVSINGIKKNKIKDELNKIIIFKSRTSFNKIFINKDKNNIISFLKNSGYYFPKVDILVENIDSNKVNINYDINLGDKSKISKIIFVGNKIFKESKLKSIILNFNTKI